jgi:hypothetical protein
VSDKAGCLSCVELEAKGRDPELRQTTGSGALSRLIDHHIRAHDAEGTLVAGCDECQRMLEGRGIKQHLWEWWARRHYVMHELGIVSDGAGHPLRFADMPAPTMRQPGKRQVPPQPRGLNADFAERRSGPR